MRKFTLLILFLFSSVVSAANVISYPERAERLRIDGEVDVLFDINEMGQTRNIRVISMKPRYVFDRSVQKQIAEWQYPKGKPQKDVSLTVIFKAN